MESVLSKCIIKFRKHNEIFKKNDKQFQLNVYSYKLLLFFKLKTDTDLTIKSRIIKKLPLMILSEYFICMTSLIENIRLIYPCPFAFYIHLFFDCCFSNLLNFVLNISVSLKYIHMRHLFHFFKIRYTDIH